MATTPLATVASRLPFRLPNLVQYVPEGSPLPANVWLSRHRAILTLVAIQALALFSYAWSSGFGFGHSLLEGGIVVLFPGIIEALRVRNRTVRATAASLGLITASAVLVHLSGGYIEMHFHFFVMLAVIALYQSWVPFGLSIVYVVIHHGVMGLIEPNSVFNHPDAIDYPWKWAAIHAAFVSAACVVYVIAWRWNEVALAQSKHILNAAGEGIFGLDTEGNILFANPAAERIVGRSVAALEGVAFTDLVAAPSGAALQATPGKLQEASVEAGPFAVPVEFLRTSVVDRGKRTGEVVTMRDITGRKEAEAALRESEHRFRSLVQNAPDLITVIASDTTVRYQSPSAARVLGYDADKLIGTKLLDILHPEDAGQFLAFVGEVLLGANHPVVIEARVKHSESGWHDLEIICTAQRHDDGTKDIVLNSRDVSERKTLESQLRHEAFHDSLTDLANRASFFDRMEHALARAGGNQTAITVLFIDLDNFKSVNDRYGHDVGDQLLIEVAQRLRACIGAGDTAARLGGDEFAVLLEDVTDNAATDVKAAQLIEAIRGVNAVGGKEVSMSASIGIATSDQTLASAGDLLRNADIAMYEAKRDGGDRLVHYTPDMYAFTLERLELVADLHGALDRNEFEVHYQPTVRLQSGGIVGFEALVRWQHPRRGLLQPDAFIRLAEDSGVIIPMGRWVLQQACQQAKAWQEAFAFDPPLNMSVNVSVHQLHDESFVDDVRAILMASGLDPSCLTLEVTESAMLHASGWMNDRLREVKALGVRLAIDDFGTGYSSLSYLHDFPFDILKVDKAFVQMEADANSRSLARAIIDLGKTLHLKIIAEGIEDVEQLERLQLLDCEFGQGYYFSKPMQAHQLQDKLSGMTQDRTAA
jgi:diguanylate cyclase (GGDEF)-like protein/PAS domain S-box-containing protein